MIAVCRCTREVARERFCTPPHRINARQLHIGVVAAEGARAFLDGELRLVDVVVCVGIFVKPLHQLLVGGDIFRRALLPVSEPLLFLGAHRFPCARRALCRVSGSHQTLQLGFGVVLLHGGLQVRINAVVVQVGNAPVLPGTEIPFLHGREFVERPRQPAGNQVSLFRRVVVDIGGVHRREQRLPVD